jgi:galactose mutarotase-like enzyme
MTRWTLSLLATALFLPAAAAQEKSGQAVHTFSPTLAESEVSAKDLAPGCPVPWTAQSRILQGGRQSGVQLIHLDNGRLRITVIPTRGMAILDVKYRLTGSDWMRLGWESPVREIVNPAFINLTARGGLGWLEGFNEFMCRCGLENVGQPGKDVIVTNTGAKAEVDLTLHGKIANIPATHVELVVDKVPPYRIRLRGRVAERMMFGPNLDLETELSTVPGSPEFRIEDKVTNGGSRPQEFQVVYHTNFGKPLLVEGARVVTPVKRVTPVNAYSAKDVRDFGHVAGPISGAIEQVYFLHPLPDKDGNAVALIHDPTKNHGVSMRWSVKQLPYLTLWKNTAAVEDGYVVGIEPGTSFPNTRKLERQMGRVPKLAAGASHVMTIDFAVHPGAKELQPVIEQIGALQQTQPPTIDEAPPKE